MMPRLKPTYWMGILMLLGAPEVKPAETYGNFHTIGVVLDAPKGVAPARIREVRLFQVQNGKSRRLLDPVQVHNYSYYAGSVFGLQPGTEYVFSIAAVTEGREYANAATDLYGRAGVAMHTRHSPLA